MPTLANAGSDSAQFLLSSTIKLVKEKLDPHMFWQIHRGRAAHGVQMRQRLGRRLIHALDVIRLGREVELIFHLGAESARHLMQPFARRLLSGDRRPKRR